jgi:hypothetical protein
MPDGELTISTTTDPLSVAPRLPRMVMTKAAESLHPSLTPKNWMVRLRFPLNTQGLREPCSLKGWRGMTRTSKR